MHQSLKDFIAHLTNKGDEFPLKIMGARRHNAYYSATMIADIYSATDDPDQGTPVAAPFGTINRMGTMLDAAQAFSNISAPPNGLNFFQGDVIELDLHSNLPVAIPPQRYAMIISHSCDVSNSPLRWCARSTVKAN